MFWNLMLYVDYPGQCYIESHNKAYTVGSHYPIGVCHAIDCHSDFSATKRS